MLKVVAGAPLATGAAASVRVSNIPPSAIVSELLAFFDSAPPPAAFLHSSAPTSPSPPAYADLRPRAPDHSLRIAGASLLLGNRVAQRELEVVDASMAGTACAPRPVGSVLIDVLQPTGSSESGTHVGLLELRNDSSPK
ncbi:hypothetical protein EJB05_37547, partial [Eragrostis curvula]